MRPELWQTLVDVLDGLMPRGPGVAAVRPVAARLDLPMEVELGSAGQPRIHADLPRWRWRTAFDRQPGRLQIRLEEEMS